MVKIILLFKLIHHNKIKIDTQTFQDRSLSVVLCSLFCSHDPTPVWGCFISLGWAGYCGRGFLPCHFWNYLDLSCVVAGTVLWLYLHWFTHPLNIHTYHISFARYVPFIFCYPEIYLYLLPKTALFQWPAMDHWWAVCSYGPLISSCTTAASCLCCPSMPVTLPNYNFIPVSQIILH